ncbi:MAG: hypothetical protein FRX49_10073 [Trebouxia sp. A1-2]|nr:MAG: hypothetical protein FRX49_10073 [Trebouxia sp. A1-2]
MAINVVFTVTIVVLVPMQGFTFFMISASRGHLSVAEELLMATAGADVDARRWPLLFAADEGHIEILYELLAYGVDCNHFHYGMTPLHYACGNGQLQVVQCLLRHGAKPSLKDQDVSNRLLLTAYVLSPSADTNLMLVTNAMQTVVAMLLT